MRGLLSVLRLCIILSIFLFAVKGLFPSIVAGCCGTTCPGGNLCIGAAPDCPIGVRGQCVAPLESCSAGIGGTGGTCPSGECCGSNGLCGTCGGTGGGGSQCLGCKTPTNSTINGMYYILSQSAVSSSPTSATVTWVPSDPNACGSGVMMAVMTAPGGLYL